MVRETISSDLESLFYTLDQIERRVSSYKYGFEKNFHETQWEIKRLEWYKNRIIFQKIFHFKILSKKFFKLIVRKKNLDLTLINFWKNSNFRNLCTVEVIDHSNRKNLLTSMCRIPLYERPFGLIYKTHTKSGCICCVNEKFSKEPIWWDQMKKISNYYRKEIGNKISSGYKKKNFRKKKICEKNYQKV